MELVLYVFTTGFCSGVAVVIFGLSFMIQRANQAATGSSGGVVVARVMAASLLLIALFSALQAYMVWRTCLC